jgi:dTDP-4-dehydrorhamnose 3,5-epimerase
LGEQATVIYLCSITYDPARERTIHPFDPDLGVRWPESAGRLSKRDAGAPGYAELRDRGLLPNLRQPTDV